MKFSSSPRLWCSCSYFFFCAPTMKHPPFKNLCFKITSSRQKNSTSTQLFSDAREKRPFPRAVPSFRARIFGIKKNSLTRADGGRWSSLYDDRYHSDDSFWNALLLCGVVRLSKMRFVSFLKRFFSRVASRKLITVGVIFFFSPNSHKTSPKSTMRASIATRTLRA